MGFTTSFSLVNIVLINVIYKSKQAHLLLDVMSKWVVDVETEWKWVFLTGIIVGGLTKERLCCFRKSHASIS